MDEINLEKIHDELIEGFARLEYEKQYPSLSCHDLDKWKLQYMSDSYFNSRVKYLVSGIMTIITNNIK